MIRRILLFALLLLPPWRAHALELTGEIADQAGAPLPGVVVVILAAGPRVGSSPLSPYAYPDCGKRALTDEHGHFRLAALDPALDFCIIATAPGYEPAIDSALRPEKGALKFKLRARDPAKTPPGWRFAGRIIGPAGDAVAGAALNVEGVEQDGSPRWSCNLPVENMAISDLHGEFQLTASAELSAVNVIVTAPGRCLCRARLEPAKMALVRMMKVGATVRGRLLLAGQPLAGAALGMCSAERQFGKFIKDLQAVTNQQGRFEFPNLPPNMQWQLFGFMDSLGKNGVAFRADVTSAEEGAVTDLGDLSAAPAYRVAGRVVLADGKPIPPGTRLLLSRERAWDRELTLLGEDGGFSAAGLPGEQISLIASVPGYRTSAKNPNLDPWDRRSLTGTLRGDLDGMKILLEPGPPLSPGFEDVEHPSTETSEAAGLKAFQGAP